MARIKRSLLDFSPEKSSEDSFWMWSIVDDTSKHVKWEVKELKGEDWKESDSLVIKANREESKEDVGFWESKWQFSKGDDAAKTNPTQEALLF